MHAAVKAINAQFARVDALLTLVLAREAYPDLDVYKLGELARFFGFKAEATQRAGPDAEATAELHTPGTQTLDDVGRTDDAIAIFRSIRADDPLYPDALDAQVRTLSEAERFGEALAVASAAAQSRSASSDDHARLADVYSAMDRHNEAAAAEGVLARLRAGQRVAYASDAGTPAVSAPSSRRTLPS